MQQQRILRRARVFRDRSDPLQLYDDTELIERYRMPRNLIIDVINILSDDITPRTNRNQAVSTHLQVLVALRFFASGSFQRVFGDTCGLSQPHTAA